MAGRKRLPTKIHLVKGTAQPCRINPDEPEAPSGPPRAPQSLAPTEAEWFGKVTAWLEGMQIASWVDQGNVMLLAKRLAEIEECDREIKENGRNYSKYKLLTLPDGSKRAQKILKANPAVAQRSEAMRHAQALLAEFGLSPAARPKVARSGQALPSQLNPWQQLIMQRRSG